MKRKLTQLRVLAETLESVDKDDLSGELSCEERQTLLPACVEAELRGENVAERFPDLWQHLLICDACGSIYADLLEVTMLEEAGQLPDLITIPTPDLSFLPSLAPTMRRAITDIATTIVTRLVPESTTTFTLLCEVFFERVEALGGAFQIHSASDLALAFGAETSFPLSILAATFETTRNLTSMVEQRPTTDVTEWSDLIKQTAHKQARQLGLSRSQANKFAAEYLQTIREHPNLLSNFQDAE